jgi:TonB-linked SusC/RagA family outer membrane protein
MRDTYFEVGLNYDRTFSSHTFGGLILYNQKKLYNPNLAYVIPNGHQGLVGRISYNYKMRYMAEFNVGYNGTENFAVGKRFGLFPAYSLGWVLTEESFFPENTIVPYIKIRGSYGEVGKDNIGNSRFLYMPSSYVYSSNEDFNTRNAGASWFGEYGSTYQIYQASYEYSLGNPDLTWERAKKINIGIDLVLLTDRIRLTFDYFHERRDNILTTPQTTPAIVGITLPVVNWGKVKNSGYEGDITYTDNIGDFNYWIRGNYSYAHNVILFQDEVPRVYPHMMRTGHSIDQPFGYIAEGFFNTWEEVLDPNRPVFQSQNSYVMPGDTRYKDITGDGILNENDQVPIGYPTFPEVIYGISFGGSYKGFDFSMLFQGAAKYSRWYMAANSHLRPFDNALSTLAFIPKYSWTQEKYETGETIRLPRLTADMTQSNNYASSTFMLADASYLRLKNAEIGYSIQTEFLKRLNISACRIYLNGNNLLTWSGLFPGIDPEQGLIGGDQSYYPMTRTFNLGISVQF